MITNYISGTTEDLIFCLRLQNILGSVQIIPLPHIDASIPPFQRGHPTFQETFSTPNPLYGNRHPSSPSHSLPKLNDGRAFISQVAAVSGGAVGAVATKAQAKELGALWSVP